MSLSSWLPGAILGGAGLLAAAPSTFHQISDRGRNILKQQGELTKQEGELRLTDEERKKVAAEAASINTNDLMEVGKLWQEQFQAVRVELALAQRWRKRMTAGLRVLAGDIRLHQEWDEQAHAANPELPLPPPLTLPDLGDIDEDNPDGQV